MIIFCGFKPEVGVHRFNWTFVDARINPKDAANDAVNTPSPINSLIKTRPKLVK